MKPILLRRRSCRGCSAGEGEVRRHSPRAAVGPVRGQRRVWLALSGAARKPKSAPGVTRFNSPGGRPPASPARHAAVHPQVTGDSARRKSGIAQAGCQRGGRSVERAADQHPRRSVATLHQTQPAPRLRYSRHLAPPERCPARSRARVQQVGTRTTGAAKRPSAAGSRRSSPPTEEHSAPSCIVRLKISPSATGRGASRNWSPSASPIAQMALRRARQVERASGPRARPISRERLA